MAQLREKKLTKRKKKASYRADLLVDAKILFEREKTTRRVNRSPTSRERRDGVEAAGKVDSTSRVLFPCASTM